MSWCVTTPPVLPPIRVLTRLLSFLVHIMTHIEKRTKYVMPCNLWCFSFLLFCMSLYCCHVLVYIITVLCHIIFVLLSIIFVVACVICSAFHHSLHPSLGTAQFSIREAWPMSLSLILWRRTGWWRPFTFSITIGNPYLFSRCTRVLSCIIIFLILSSCNSSVKCGSFLIFLLKIWHL